MRTGSNVMATPWGAEPAHLGVKAGSTSCQLCGLGQVAYTFSASPWTDTAWKTGASRSGRLEDSMVSCLQSTQDRIGTERAPGSRVAAGPRGLAASTGAGSLPCEQLPLLREAGTLKAKS